MATTQTIDPADCPEPFWHETHRYCPRCSWKEASPVTGETEGRIAAAYDAHWKEPGSAGYGAFGHFRSGWLVRDAEGA